MRIDVINMVEKNNGEKSKEEGVDQNFRTNSILEDVKIDVKIKLAFFWVALSFLYIYNDIFTLLQAGNVAQLIHGEIDGIYFDQTVLFGSAVLMALPIFMVVLSLILKAKMNRKVNISLGIFHAVLLIPPLFAPGELWAYYALYMIFEGLFIAMIIWYAWKWPIQGASPVKGTKVESSSTLGAY
jgi:hypothetical protein